MGLGKAWLFLQAGLVGEEQEGGEDNERRKQDERFFEVKFDFKAVAKEQDSRVARKFTSRQATEAKARLPQVHGDLTLSRSGHQVQASSSGDEKVAKDELKHPRLHLISRIK